MHTDVVIIGAGAAGLAATKVLDFNGISNIVLEASDRIGGRAFTDNTSFSIPCDMGAHWLHYGDYLNPFINYAFKNRDQFQITVDPYTSEKPYMLFDKTAQIGDKLLGQNEVQGFHQMEKQASKDLWWYLKNKGPNPVDVSLHEEIIGSASKYDPWLGTIALAVGNWDMAKDWVDISNVDYQRSPDYQGRPDFLCKEGYGALLQYSARRVAPDVSLNTNVTSVSYSNGGVKIESNNGTLNAKACIVTVSNGAIVAGLDGKTDSLVIPNIPQNLETAFREMPMGNFERVIFEFDHNVFGGVDHQYAMHRVDDINVRRPRGFVFTTNVFGSNLVYADVGGSYAKELVNSGKKALIEAATDEITDMLGSGVTSHLAKKLKATCWTDDPLFLGAFASPRPGSAHQRRVLKETPPINEVIFFAGEACHTFEWATVSGAHKSGCLAANRVLNRLVGVPVDEYHCDRAEITD